MRCIVRGSMLSISSEDAFYGTCKYTTVFRDVKAEMRQV